ncbi:hypothetical protein DYQ86_06610 [Acidobacteria bacterium AB60]|nr:hypothetical protein DYQ86_06610 [Acidobacteria bacterium AB60]
MPLNPAMAVMSAVEFLLWATLAYMFWAKKLQKRFPVMGYYLALRLFSTPVLLAALLLQSRPGGDWLYGVYSYGFYGVYIACAVLLFFVCLEVFRSALSAFSGLVRFGIVIFRWAAVVSLILSLTTVSFAHRGSMMLCDFAFSLMRSVSLLELCLLAFLCLAMSALQLPIRDKAFGLSLGFGVLAANDLILTALIKSNSSLNEPFQYVYEALVLLALGIWVAYTAMPEPVRKPIVVAANSTIYRWNEIASALGHKGANVAVPQTANSFFLTDVEKVVEKVLTRNLKENESKAS